MNEPNQLKDTQSKQTPPGAVMPLRGGLPAIKQRRVAEFIEEHLAEEISLATLAELVDLSLFHFARAFKQSFGMPPHRYHMIRRMERARGLLLRSALSVTQIGIQIGFREASSFTRAYRKFAGVAPSEYRRHRENESSRCGTKATLMEEGYGLALASQPVVISR
jgi:AraC family transcriptional regulator